MSKGGEGRRLLLVDDDPGAVELLSLLLESEGFAARSATCVAEALAEAEAWQPDALLTDINLPDGTGLDLAEQLKRVQPELVVVAISGLDATCIHGLPGASEVQHIVSKPLDFDHLVKTLRAALN